MHLYGDGLNTHLELIKGFERTTQLRDTRAKYTKSNKDLFARLSRPIDKVFTAKGGTIYYNLPETTEKAAIQVSNNIKNGISIKKWLETQWKNQTLYDPCGITFLEIMQPADIAKAKEKRQSFVYPTYKSVGSIFDYKPIGNKLEYVIFNLTQEEKIYLDIDVNHTCYRVVDDAYDYIVRKDGDNITIIDNHTIANYFGEVPAIINSDLSSHKSENHFISFFDEVVELADQYLLDGSVRSMHKLLHGFPKYVEYADNCPSCNGDRFKDGVVCKSCLGTGRKVMTNVGDIKLLPVPGSKDEHLINPANVAAYISPDKIYHDISTQDIQALEDAMSVTQWGVQSRIRTSGMGAGGDGVKTATEVVDEMKPQADRLIMFTEMAEKRHKFILDLAIRVNLNVIGYNNSSVIYGRRFLLENTDALWEKYSNARTKGSPLNILDALLLDYLESVYQSDPVGLAVAKKLMYVEPFVHYDIAKVKTLGISDEDYKAKLYYSEWLSTQTDAMLLISNDAALKESLKTYSKEKQLAEPQKQLATV